VRGKKPNVGIVLNENLDDLSRQGKSRMGTELQVINQLQDGGKEVAWYKERKNKTARRRAIRIRTGGRN